MRGSNGRSGEDRRGAMLIRVLRQRGSTPSSAARRHLDAILQAAADDGMRLIDTRHEQAAGHAADGWLAPRQAGRGHRHRGARHDRLRHRDRERLPRLRATLFIAGAAPLREARDAAPGGSISAMVTPITSGRSRDPHRADPDLVRKRSASRLGRPGPVFLELPSTSLFFRGRGVARRVPEKIFPDSAPAPAPEAVSRAIEWLHAPRSGDLAGAALFSGPGTIFSARGEDGLRRSSRTRRLTGWCRGITALRSGFAISPSRRGVFARPICAGAGARLGSSRAAGARLIPSGRA